MKNKTVYYLNYLDRYISAEITLNTFREACKDLEHTTRLLTRLPRGRLSRGIYDAAKATIGRDFGGEGWINTFWLLPKHQSSCEIKTVHGVRFAVFHEEIYSVGTVYANVFLTDDVIIEADFWKYV